MNYVDDNLRVMIVGFRALLWLREHAEQVCGRCVSAEATGWLRADNFRRLRCDQATKAHRRVAAAADLGARLAAAGHPAAENWGAGR